jgi:serine/threonine protein phosphatase PrpC
MGKAVANWGAATSPGLVRTRNEDAVLAQFPVFMVADGMGGQAGGDVASTLVSEEFRALAESAPLTIADVSRAIHAANRAVVTAAGADSALEGMGTTLVGLALVEDRDSALWLAFNVGDSRLYRYFGDVLTQVTTDHSEVQALVDEGAISAEAARVHANRNVITRAVGVYTSVEPDFWLLPPVPGERFLICSDGLSNEVDDDTIAGFLGGGADPAVTATRLVERAVANGGHDNISAVVVDLLRIDEPGGEVDTARLAELASTTRVGQARTAQPPAHEPLPPPGELGGADEPAAFTGHPGDDQVMVEVPRAPAVAGASSAEAADDPAHEVIESVPRAGGPDPDQPAGAPMSGGEPAGA